MIRQEHSFVCRRLKKFRNLLDENMLLFEWHWEWSHGLRGRTFLLVENLGRKRSKNVYIESLVHSFFHTVEILNLRGTLIA